MSSAYLFTRVGCRGLVEGLFHPLCVAAGPCGPSPLISMTLISANGVLRYGNPLAILWKITLVGVDTVDGEHLFVRRVLGLITIPMFQRPCSECGKVIVPLFAHSNAFVAIPSGVVSRSCATFSHVAPDLEQPRTGSAVDRGQFSVVLPVFLRPKCLVELLHSDGGGFSGVFSKVFLSLTFQASAAAGFAVSEPVALHNGGAAAIAFAQPVGSSLWVCVIVSNDRQFSVSISSFVFHRHPPSDASMF